MSDDGFASSDSEESGYAEVGHFSTMDEVLSNVRQGIFRANICGALDLTPGERDVNDNEDEEDEVDPKLIGGCVWEVRECGASEARAGEFCVKVKVGVGVAGADAHGWRDYNPEGDCPGSLVRQASGGFFASQSEPYEDEEEDGAAARQRADTERLRQTLRNEVKAGLKQSRTRFNAPCEVQTWTSKAAAVQLDVLKLLDDATLAAFCVDRGEAMIALSSNAFRYEPALEMLRGKYVDEGSSAGQSAPEYEPTDVDTDGMFECPVCLNDVAFNGDNVLHRAAQARPGRCGHLFCDACWCGALRDAERHKSKLLTFGCQAPDCSRRCSLAELRHIASLEESGIDADQLIHKCESWLVDDCVGKDPYCAHCPTGGCNSILRVEGVKRRKDKGGGAASGAAASSSAAGAAAKSREESQFGGVVCTECFNGICWLCSKEAHEPCVCREVDEWLEKTGDESDLWLRKLKASVKQCPSCHAGCAIDAKVACNHMTCVCGHEWCWMCLKPYAGHGGSFYECNQFNTGEVLAADEERETSLMDIRRMEHYKDLTQMQEKGTSAEARRDMDEALAKLKKRLESALGKTEMQLQFLDSAREMIFRARLALKWSFVLLYFVDEGHDGREKVGRAQGEAQGQLDKLELMLKTAKKTSKQTPVDSDSAYLTTRLQMVPAVAAAGKTNVCEKFTKQAKICATTKAAEVDSGDADAVSMAVCDAVFDLFAADVRTKVDQLGDCLSRTLFKARHHLGMDSTAARGRRVWQYEQKEGGKPSKKKSKKSKEIAVETPSTWIDFDDDLQPLIEDAYAAYREDDQPHQGAAAMDTSEDCSQVSLPWRDKLIFIDFQKMHETLNGGRPHKVRSRIERPTPSGSSGVDIGRFGDKKRTKCPTCGGTQSAGAGNACIHCGKVGVQPYTGS